MNKLILVAMLGLSAQAVFAQTCRVDMVDRANRIVRTFNVYGTPGNCIEGMKECRKSIRLDYSTNAQYPNGSLDCVQVVAQAPRPIPQQPIPQQPIPRPQPQPAPYYGVTVSGIVEDAFFTMTARDASELYMNCLTDIRRVGYGSADEIFFSANNGRFVSASTPGWYNDTQICSILEQEARRSTGQVAYTSQMRVQGSLEREPFQILANNRAELLNNCIGAFTATRQGQTDELTYSLNGAPFQRVSTSGWWNTPARACKAMISVLDGQIR